jgi:hypothetical protein
MVDIGVTLLTDRSLRRAIGEAAASDVRQRFCEGIVVPQYERYYDRVLSERAE